MAGLYIFTRIFGFLLLSLTLFRSQAGESKVTVKSSCPESTEWANLQDVKVQTVHDFLDQTSSQNYLFDWSLPLNAPKLAADFKIPQYFSHNLLMKTPLGSLYRDSWPSLFIGPRGTKSGLHIDAFGSHFWMYLVSGVKKWTFYPPERAGDLNPVFFDSMDPVFNPSIDSFHNIQHYSVGKFIALTPYNKNKKLRKRKTTIRFKSSLQVSIVQCKQTHFIIGH